MVEGLVEHLSRELTGVLGRRVVSPRLLSGSVIHQDSQNSEKLFYSQL